MTEKYIIGWTAFAVRPALHLRAYYMGPGLIVKAVSSRLQPCTLGKVKCWFPYQLVMQNDLFLAYSCGGERSVL